MSYLASPMKFFPVALLFFCLAPGALPAAPAWTYDDDYTGQEDWGSIPGYETCAAGTSQSPVVISYTTTQAPALALEYSAAKGTFVRSNTTFAINISGGGAATDGTQLYKLSRIELHTPSEHMIKDDFYPVEIHLIHKNARGQRLIVAVFAGLGAPNPTLAAMLAGERRLDPSGLLPATRGYYGYDGSLTAPPCSEGVKWRVLKTPIAISHAQLAALGKLVGRNARLPQPLYLRTVTETP